MEGDDDLIVQFVSITGASTSDAVQYIEMAEGDMQKAIDLYLDMGGNGNQAASTNNSGTSYNQALFEDEVREAIPSRYDQLIGGPTTALESMRGWVNLEPAIPSLAELEAQAVQDEFEDAGLGHLYRPPEDVNTQGNLADAMKTAKESKKWLLGNIQAADEFASHILNRDIWSHDTVKEVIRSAFVFWQRDRSSAQGTQFVANYNITDLPIICIIDPRTGRKVKSWSSDKFKGPLTATDLLSDFIGENPYGSTVAPTGGSRTISSGDNTGGSSARSVDSEVINIVASPVPTKVARTEEKPASLPTTAVANPGDADEVKVAIRLPNGQKKQVGFKGESPVTVIKDWVSATENLLISTFEVRLSHPPKPLDMTSGDTVKSAGVGGALLVVAML